MPAARFDDLAASYELDAVVQRDAAGALLELLRVGEAEDLLDVGCGPGHLTRRLRRATRGRVEGADASPAMVEEARRAARLEAEPATEGGAERALRFIVACAEELPFESDFDAIFCNSAFHWFREPARALERMRAALRPGGRLAIQAPATERYCPSFVDAMARVAVHPDTRGTFARFRSPWLFLESAGAYAALLERSGFAVHLASLRAQRVRQSPAGAMRIFESGAVAGYLAQDCYDVPLAPSYAERVRRIVSAALAEEADADGLLDLVFRRVYLVATKE